MRENRSASQILFGYLPEQTVDLGGRVWKVSAWQDPIPKTVDDTALRRELARQVYPWSIRGRDGGYGQDLQRGRPLQVRTLNTATGVRVEAFPQVWVCRTCQRVRDGATGPCRCGAARWAQLPFVGYHECGRLQAPWVPRCPQHDDVRVTFPGTAAMKEIRFDCPVCRRTLRRGLGAPPCACGDGRIRFNVHRSASVYTPQSVVVVNPPSVDEVRVLHAAGGPARALEWVLDGLGQRSFTAARLTRQSLVDQLAAQGLDRAVAEQMADHAAATGQVATGPESVDLPPGRRAEAESQAVTVAMATSRSRRRLSDLVAAASDEPELAALYGGRYPQALRVAGLEAVELIERFPVLTGVFAYTRGIEDTRLVPFRDRRGDYVVYADIGDTEALFVRLDPVRVGTWLQARGHRLAEWDDVSSARLAIIEAAEVPHPGADAAGTAGADLLTLVHSYAHRLSRRTAVFAGIEASSLGELLVPLHLGFFLFAAPRGDFVLGGLQAVFDGELDALLLDVARAEHRCPLDPGCAHAGGACMACLHLGEPSCRLFNRYLDRRHLHGPTGFLQPALG